MRYARRQTQKEAELIAAGYGRLAMAKNLKTGERVRVVVQSLDLEAERRKGQEGIVEFYVHEELVSVQFEDRSVVLFEDDVQRVDESKGEPK